MQDHVTYEFYCCDNPLDPRDDRFDPLSGMAEPKLQRAHAMLASRLKSGPAASGMPCYVGPTGEALLADLLRRAMSRARPAGDSLFPA